MIQCGPGLRAHKTTSRNRLWRGYIVAILGIAVATLARWSLGRAVGDLPTYTAFYPVVFAAALVGGIWPGLLASLLGALAAVVFVMEPVGTFIIPTVGQATGLAVFLLINVGVSILAGRYRMKSEALRTSETRFQMAQQAADVGAFEWDVPTDVVTWTPQHEIIYGLKPGEFRGTEAAWEERVHPEDRAKALAAVKRAFETCQPVRHEWRVVWPDGTIHWVAARFQAFNDQNGKPLRLVGVNIDITDRKLADEAARRSADRFRALVTAGSYAVYRMNADWSELRELLHGQDFIADTEIPSRTWVEKYIDPADRPHMLAVMNEAVRNKSIFELEHRVRRADGSVGWVLTRAVPLQDSNGEIAEWFGTATDITKRKEAEELVRSSEERLRHFIDSAPVAIAMLDKELRHLAVSRRWLETFNLSFERVVGRRHYEVFPDIPERWKEVHKRCLAGATEADEDDLFERADGSHQWLRWEIQPWYSAAGVIGGIIIFTEDITARKNAEKASRESEERFRTMADAIPQLAWMAKPDGELFWFNERCHEFTGVALKQLTGGVWQNTIEPRVLPAVRERWKRSLATGEPYDMEFPIRRADGQYHQFLTRIVPLKDHNGRVSLWFGTATDITEQHKTQEALRETEERFRTMVNAIPQMAWMARPDGYLFGFNDRCYEYTGATAEQLEGWGWQSIVHPRLLPKVLERWKRSLATGEPYDMESALRRADGQYYPFLTRASPLKDQEGRITLWFGTATDISQLQEAREALRESEELFRQLAENIPQLAWMANADGSVFWFNKRTFDYTGETLEELRGWGWRKVLRPADMARISEEVKRAFASEQPWEDTFLIRSQSGEYRWFLSRAFPLRNNEGKVTRWFGTTTDISDIVAAREVVTRDRDELERKVEERTAKLRETVGELEHISYSMVHDMRAPLRAMQAFAQMLHEDCAECRRFPGLDYINHIREASVRLDGLITDALNYNKVVRETPSIVPVDLGKLLHGILQTYPAFHSPAADTSLEFDELFVLGNESLLTQCFSNLLDNAVKFVAPGVHPRVRIWAEPGDHQSVRVFVQDNGIGIPKHAQEKIFGMFERMHHESEYPGTGIGLTIVRKAVERMAGHIDIESDLGRGTCFCIELQTPDESERERLHEAAGTHAV